MASRSCRPKPGRHHGNRVIHATRQSLITAYGIRNRAGERSQFLAANKPVSSTTIKRCPGQLEQNWIISLTDHQYMAKGAHRRAGIEQQRAKKPPNPGRFGGCRQHALDNGDQSTVATILGGGAVPLQLRDHLRIRSPAIRAPVLRREEGGDAQHDLLGQQIQPAAALALVQAGLQL